MSKAVEQIVAPRCDCHGEPMFWGVDAGRPGGGHWRCVVKRAEAQARYDRSEKGVARSRRYADTDQGRAVARQASQLYRKRTRRVH